MSRTFSQRLFIHPRLRRGPLSARSFWSIGVGFVALTAVTACSSGAGTTTDSTTSQALSEATASAADTHAAAEACFTAFDACKAAATADADVAACKTTLDSCLPAEPRPGPHCGGPRGKGDERPGDRGGPGGGAGGPGGDCDGGGAPPPPSGSAAPPAGSDVPPVPLPPVGDHDGDGDHGGGVNGPPPGGAMPGFCKDVPLPPPAAIAACKAPLDACLSAGTDKKTCFDAVHACIKAAFDAALPPQS